MSKIMVKYHLFPKVIEKLQALMKNEGSSPRKFAPILNLSRIDLDSAINAIADPSEFRYDRFNILR